jgi:hypothetical protein
VATQGMEGGKKLFVLSEPIMENPESKEMKI